MTYSLRDTFLHSCSLCYVPNALEVFDFRDEKNTHLRSLIESALGNFLRTFAPSQPPPEVGLLVVRRQCSTY